MPAESRLLLAVSGGIDSIALLHAAVSLRKLMKWELQVAHVDHGLREESGHEARLVSQIASGLGLRFHLRKLEPPRRENLEAWGRRERYRFFKQILANENLDFVVTAHTADDVAETLLMRLLANKELKSIVSHDLSRRCLRPLLRVPRREVERYAGRHRLVYCQDRSNFDTRLLRNRVRHELLPLIERLFDPRAKEILAYRAQAVAEDIDELYRAIGPSVTKLESMSFGSPKWRRAVGSELSRLGPALRWRLCETLMKPKLGFNLGREASRRLERVLTTDPGMGVVRHVDAGYDIAIAAAERHGIKIPMLK